MVVWLFGCIALWLYRCSKYSVQNRGTIQQFNHATIPGNYAAGRVAAIELQGRWHRSSFGYLSCGSYYARMER